MNEQTIARTLYRKLRRLYPREFRARLGESMEQTFRDLCNGQKQQPGHGFLLLAIFTETVLGIVREHLFLLMEGDVMKDILASPRSAAITGFLLSLPLGLTLAAFMFEIEFPAKPLNARLTTNCYELNGLGGIFLIGGLLLLPVAFVINLRPLLRKAGPEGKESSILSI